MIAEKTAEEVRCVWKVQKMCLDEKDAQKLKMGFFLRIYKPLQAS